LAETRTTKSYGLMPLDVLETIIKKTLSFATEECTLAFQGGEPTLAGLAFFHKLIEYESQYNINNAAINHAIQTNGTLLDDDWCQFFAEHNFLVGLSLDGTAETHDCNRINAQGQGTHQAVMKAARLLQKHKVSFNILTVLNAATARRPRKIYEFYRKNGFDYMQFIPIIHDAEKPTFALSNERLADFLIQTHLLYNDDLTKGNRVSIRYFDELYNMLNGGQPSACDMRGTCSCQFVIEADGSVFPCDFYCTDEWLLGSIKDLGFPELLNSKNAQGFLKPTESPPEKCRRCEYQKLCRNGCRRLHNTQTGINRYCEGFKALFNDMLK